MQGQGEHRVILRQDRSSAIALMDIQVDDGNSLHPTFGLHQARCNRSIIEYAKTLTMVGMRMVGAAGQIDRHTLLQRSATSSDGRAGRTTRALHQLQRPWEADRFLFGRRQGAAGNALYIVWMMRQRQYAIADIRRFEDYKIGNR